MQAGKNYEYRITAVNAGGASDYSETSGQIKAKSLKGLIDLVILTRSRVCNVISFFTVHISVDCYMSLKFIMHMHVQIACDNVMGCVCFVLIFAFLIRHIHVVVLFAFKLCYMS